MSDDHPRPTIHMLHHLARSGGTLFSRCLATMRGVTLLSEVNPRGAEVALQFDPLFQAQFLQKLLTADEVDALRARTASIAEILCLIAERADERNERLVVRDWSHLDFIGKPFVDSCSGRLELHDALESAANLRQVATVRHPAAQWLSWQRFQPDSGVSLESFLAGCRQFAEQATRIGYVRYEDLVRNPDGTLRTLCALLDVEFDPQYAYRWFFYRNVNGDLPSLDRFEIKPPPAPRLSAELRGELDANEDYQKTLDLLTYRSDLKDLAPATEQTPAPALATASA